MVCKTYVIYSVPQVLFTDQILIFLPRRNFDFPLFNFFFFLLPGTKFNFLGGGGVYDFYHSGAYALVGWVKISLKSISQQMLWSANFSEISLKIVMLSHRLRNSENF